MIMEIKMNNSLTFDEVADKLGCSVEDLQKIAFKKYCFRLVVWKVCVPLQCYNLLLNMPMGFFMPVRKLIY